MQRRTSKGFTLIELLIVIAIIALLVSILFPVFARARESARRSSCQSNMKQLGLAMLQYTNDNDDRYPFPDSDLSGVPGTITTRQYYIDGYGPYIATGNDWPSWRGQIFSYAKNVQIFKCPSAPRSASAANPDANSERVPSDTTTYFPISYGFNGGDQTGQIGLSTDQQLVTGDYISEYILNNSVLKVAVPSETIMLYESMYKERAATDWAYLLAVAGNYNRCPDIPVSQANLYATVFFGGHLATSNYLFADGHVKALKITQTITPKNMWTIRDDGATVPTAGAMNMTTCFERSEGYWDSR